MAESRTVQILSRTVQTLHKMKIVGLVVESAIRENILRNIQEQKCQAFYSGAKGAAVEVEDCDSDS